MRRFKLTKRDIMCFREFLDMGFLTAKQLVNLCVFPNEKKARDRLNLFHQAGYVNHCTKPYFGPGRAEYVYYLNQKKVDEILSLLGYSGEDVCLTKPSSYSPMLLHHLAITDFVICIKQACKQSGVYKAEIIPEYKHLHGRTRKLKKSISQGLTIEGMTTEIIPDGVICLSRQKDTAKTLLFFEIYRGTQTMQGGEHSIQHKLEAYVAYWEQDLYESFSDLFSYSFKGFRVLLIIHTVSHLEKMEKICQIAPTGLFWLALSKDIKPETVFEPIWCVPGEKEPKALVNLEKGS